MQNFTKPNSNMFAQIMVMGISDFFSKVGRKSVELIFLTASIVSTSGLSIYFVVVVVGD